MSINYESKKPVQKWLNIEAVAFERWSAHFRGQQ